VELRDLPQQGRKGRRERGREEEEERGRIRDMNLLTA